MSLLNFRKIYIYLAILLGFLSFGLYLSLYAYNIEDKRIKIIPSIDEKKKEITNTGKILKLSISLEEKKENEKVDKKTDNKPEIKHIKFRSEKNKRFLNLSEKARINLKKQGINIFIKLAKKYYHCNKFGCYLNYNEFSKTRKKTFVVRMINSKTNEKKSIVYFISYIIKDKGFDITEKLKKHTIQDKSLSCESSSASDIISYLTNKNIVEDEIIEQLKGKWFNKKVEIDEKTGKKYWGDPELGFVGYIDDYEEIIIEDKKEEDLSFESSLSELDEIIKLEKEYKKKFDKKVKIIKATQHSMAGYGVYEKPFLSIYDSYNLKGKIINKNNYKNMGLNTKSHMKKLLKELRKGNMVQLWGDYCTLPEFEDGKIQEKDVREKEDILEKGVLSAQNTCNQSQEERKLEWYIREDGKERLFTGLSGEHNFYLLGYKGNIENPTSIIVWDTYTGKHTYPVKEWYRKWGLMQNRSIIVSKK